MLDLKCNNLCGTIPPLCSNLSNLRMIDLSENLLQGKIPRLLANCTILEQLVLENNLINDTFPSKEDRPRVESLLRDMKNRSEGSLAISLGVECQ